MGGGGVAVQARWSLYRDIQHPSFLGHELFPDDHLAVHTSGAHFS